MTVLRATRERLERIFGVELTEHPSGPGSAASERRDRIARLGRDTRVRLTSEGRALAGRAGGAAKARAAQLRRNVGQIPEGSS